MFRLEWRGHWKQQERQLNSGGILGVRESSLRSEVETTMTSLGCPRCFGPAAPATSLLPCLLGKV